MALRVIARRAIDKRGRQKLIAALIELRMVSPPGGAFGASQENLTFLRYP